MLALLNIKKKAAEAGFDLCGVAPCRPLAEGERRFRDWLAGGYNASLGYLERNVEKRFDPSLLVEGARTAVVCAVGYKNGVGEGYPPGHRTKVASYACARDYHTTLREMLARLFEALRADCPGLRGRAFVDTAPLAEKLLAVEAGLGWIGRQSLLVTPSLGSYVVLGELLLEEETDRYDSPFVGSRCGSCRVCVERCPTGAILARGGSTPGAASPAIPSSARRRTPCRSTAGSSAAMPAKAAVPIIGVLRSTAIRLSTPFSTPLQWLLPIGTRWTTPPSTPEWALRR